MTPARRTVRATASYDLRQLPPERGMLVPHFAVVGRVAPDGAIELVQLDIDLTGNE